MNFRDHLWRVLGQCTLALSLVGGGCATGAKAQPEPAPTPECVRVQAIARWAAAAYNHIVRIDNDCERPVACQVSTDVNPRVHRIRVEAGSHAELLTFRGSPASRFRPNVECVLD